jgi:hypothetical protein
VTEDIAEYRESELVLRGGLSFEEWAELGSSLNRIGQGVMWWLGDWWRYGEHNYGESAAQAAPTGLAVKTLQNAAWCAERIPPVRRRADVPFGHHSTVAALPPAEADALLAETAEEQLKVSELRERVREIKGDTPKPKKEPEPDKTVHFVSAEFYKAVFTDLRGLADEMITNGAAGYGLRLKEILEEVGER